MPLYDKPVRLLMHDMVADLVIQPGQIVEREQVIDWFKQKYPLVKEGTIAAHLLRMSINAPSRLHHNLQNDGSDDLFYQMDSARFRLYDRLSDPAPLTKTRSVTPPLLPPGEKEVDATPAASEFAYERDLRNFLSKNLSLVETGLRLYEEEGVNGIEFPAGGRFIDILAVDGNGSYVVIELKVARGYDRVVGQLLRYMGWIEQHHAERGRRVRGVIVAKDISDDLVLACSRIPDVALYEYELSVTLRQLPGSKSQGTVA